ncbi:Dihydrolipoyllysine-residue acetyltransferase component of pyruvate dehydrogenase complex [Kordia antarctica]|uniref:Dihydrolipoamide acetyltransferase component of pyruvate dehydrogenase complex n=1 Tax=Kordia antarctica TaxID=1218801 RepID=A0A7L4ZJI8_9FLAO|nr:dihydrolipoamide acetyltransferase family protein [Kordia antarctica]QHI36792.1 Dihydrolipoyllysine-residue acetyltransferase component of pyruvate dehydrogenase complex [Kordia antarctica]
MPIISVKMPKMGESISEATIISWLKNVGDTIEIDETILEVATDKVDSEVPSPCTGVITEIRFQPNDIVPVGEIIALIDASETANIEQETANDEVKKETLREPKAKTSTVHHSKLDIQYSSNPDAFLSPLIVSIAKKENMTIEEVQSISGTGAEGRIRKSDVFNYLKNRQYPLASRPQAQPKVAKSSYNPPPIKYVEGHDTVVEMDRMRKMIADHMVYSKHTSPHVTAYIEIDVTNMVNWRNTSKIPFQEKYNERLTFTPLFVEAVAKAVIDFPGINASVSEDGKKVIERKDINIGMATALPSGNLIVPVVRNADEKNLKGLAAEVNHLANASRENKLKPEEIQGSTFTISNVGTFGSLMGTPIINQPEVAILALGIIKKRPEVITTENGDEIAIRSMMYLSLSFDHRVVDGYLGGSFLRKVGDYLEAFDPKRKI